MKLYHGSLVKVITPRIIPTGHTSDYGTGFYTTTSFEQAERWVKRKLNENQMSGYVNVYEWDENAKDVLSFLHFPKVSEEWIDFVHNNRTVPKFTHDYDIVYGPVANDKVYAAFALFEQGFIDKPTLIREMRAYKLVDQMLFHTEKSLESLTYLDSKEISI